MKQRIVVATLLVMLLIPQPIAAISNESNPCAEPVNNSTLKQVCDQNEQLEKKNSQLDSKVNDLQNRVKTLNGKVETLQYQLNQTGGSSDLSELPSSLNPVFKSLGMWNPYTNEPAVVIRYEQAGMPFLWQWVGPGLGSEGPKNSFVPVAEPTAEEVRPEVGEKAKNVTFDLKYARSGMKTHYELPPSEYDDKTQVIENKMNTLQGWGAVTLRLTTLLKGARNLRSLIIGGIVALFLTGLTIGSYIGDRSRPWSHLKNRRKAEKNKQDTGENARVRGPDTSVIDDEEDDDDDGFLSRWWS